MASQPFGVNLAEALLSGVERLVAAENAGGDAAGVAEADDAYVTQLWNGHWRWLLPLLATARQAG